MTRNYWHADTDDYAPLRNGYKIIPTVGSDEWVMMACPFGITEHAVSLIDYHLAESAQRRGAMLTKIRLLEKH